MSAATKILDTVLDRAVVPGYTKIGYELRSKFWAADPTPGALEGKTAVVTGANSGLGKATVAALAKLGASVHLVVRDAAKGERARDEIAEDVPNAHLEIGECDVSNLASVREFAKAFTAQHGSLDVLVHNAGSLPPSRSETPEGNEVTLATHVLGPFLLTGLLREPLAAAKGRVVFVTSGGMYAARLHSEDPQYRQGEYKGGKAYARTKRMQVVLAEQWAQRLADTGVTVHSTHPGWADTPGVSGSLPGFNKVMGPLLRTPEQGADTIVWLAAAEEPGHSTGGFWHDRRIRPTHYLPWQHDDPQDRKELWDLCVRATGLVI
ncbi:SDR family NAD(P)-dependent oxidoreductase [Actinokineospora cianjurensis]|uniref:NAD(P)-dependent dehydrogenase (Short-subunit alcohol dehydrogenase family) n=1 Tax=Actinokineospora cianjurensis TaxID=585224 RepID=A0A421B710_9PSEU|nr:SDR family NAD(P)-dependent oxidoreductase [Actinokineospora cianjurensis]RLK60079.1 NAD(P)-dependent dehydrogenase (short-subunit alcohol dehydrogenase family) [Actinokineospora cianjurensis]